MENLYPLMYLTLLGAVAYFLLFREKKIDNKQPEIDKKITETEDHLQNSPVDSGATKPVEDKIQETGNSIKEVQDTIAEKEKQIEEIQNTPKEEKPVDNPQAGADWVNSVTDKKTPLILLCFLFTSSLVYSADPIYKGKSYIPKQDGVALSMKELNSLREKVEETEKLQKLNAEYISLLKDYKKLKTLQGQQIEQFATLDKLKQESIVIYKESITSYKDIIGEMRENNKEIEKKFQQQRRTSRFQRNLNLILGYAAPILGAMALGQIGK